MYFKCNNNLFENHKNSQFSTLKRNCCNKCWQVSFLNFLFKIDF